MRLTTLAHQIVGAALQADDIAIDATVGNGHDTIFLATQVGANGHVFGFDIQQCALARATSRLQTAGVSCVTLTQHCHSQMLSALPQHAIGHVAAVMFNLGYLPSGDKSVTTLTKTTLAAVAQALKALKPGGLLSVLAYPGHPAGHLETREVTRFLQDQLSATHIHVGNTSNRKSPQLLIGTR